MKKTLTIRYGDLEVFNGPVAHFTFAEENDVFTITAGIKPKPNQLAQLAQLAQLTARGNGVPAAKQVTQ